MFHHMLGWSIEKSFSTNSEPYVADTQVCRDSAEVPTIIQSTHQSGHTQNALPSHTMTPLYLHHIDDIV